MRVHIWWQRWDPIVEQFVDNSMQVQGNSDQCSMTVRSGGEYKSQLAMEDPRDCREQELMTQQAGSGGVQMQRRCYSGADKTTG